MAQSFLRLPAVMARTGLSRSTIYLRMKAGALPKQVKLGGARAVGWVESEIDECISQQIRESRGTPSPPPHELG
jgi:prophage regulatory protein